MMKRLEHGNSAGGTHSGPGNQRSNGRPAPAAFTLLEVMIAGGILFMCLFAILALVSSGLRNAALLQHQKIDASMAAALLTVQFSTTNQVAEGKGSGDFGSTYPDYRYEWTLTQVGTNGLCELDIEVRGRSLSKPVESALTTLIYLPNLQQNNFGAR